MDDKQLRQVSTRDMLTDLALGAAARLPEREQLAELTPEARDRLAVTAAVGYLVGLGLINQPDPHALAWAPREIPEHLRPSIVRAVTARRAIPDRLAAVAR